MSGPSELAILAGVLADTALKGTVVLGGCWVATRLVRSAAHRHVLWASALASLPCLAIAAGMRGPTLALDTPSLIGFWAVGCGAAFVPMLRGLLSLYQLQAIETAEAGVFHSDGVSSPVTYGSVILMPHAAQAWSKADREAALAHERAHLARGDWLVHIGAWCVCALFWFHPMVWLARQHLAREAEHAADDLVLRSGVKPSDYATLLLSLSHRPPPRGALGAGSLVAERVRAVLAPGPRSTTRWPALLVAIALFLAVIPMLSNWSAWSSSEAELTCAPAPH